jgi:SAM-dependent methyltransferase
MEVSTMESRQIETVYDLVADRYADQFRDELDHKPFDRHWLDRFAALTQGIGPVCDLGCGPGHVAAYLRDRGCDVVGADFSEGMLRQARRLNPSIEFQRQDMLELTFPPDALGGIAAFYAIVHFTLDQAEVAFREFRRVLAPGGFALLSFHIGDEPKHVDEFLGMPVAIDFAFFDPDDIVDRLTTAGLDIEEVTIRYPYRDVEYPSKRAYILSRKPV